MKRMFFLLIVLTFLVACGPKTYVECKNPIKVKGKIYCEK